jgi:hypothetical protein
MKASMLSVACSRAKLSWSEKILIVPSAKPKLASPVVGWSANERIGNADSTADWKSRLLAARSQI